jgi:hypothetical protein
LSTVAVGVIGAVVTVSLSIFGYIHQRQKIPKLSFDGYYKTDKEFITGNIPSIITTYCVKVKDINHNSEGEIKSCAGSIVVENNSYRTVWMFDNKRHKYFVNEAWLKLFDHDRKNETIGFFGSGEESNAKRIESSYGRRIDDKIVMKLVSARGHCPLPHIENIEYIIKNAQYFS